MVQANSPLHSARATNYESERGIYTKICTPSSRRPEPDVVTAAAPLRPRVHPVSLCTLPTRSGACQRSLTLISSKKQKYDIIEDKTKPTWGNISSEDMPQSGPLTPENTACINSLIGTKLSSGRQVYIRCGALSHPCTGGGIDFFLPAGRTSA